MKAGRTEPICPSAPTPFFISSSSTTTESNKTGSWRFLRPRYDEKTAPCSAACPAGEDISRVEMLTAQGLFKEAWETILAENPFPALCGRVCSHPCESLCNRREFDEAVGIHSIERFLADMAARYGFKAAMARSEARRERVAVVGAGPSGLSAAYFLALLGYRCEVFESMPEPGGLPRWGIPPYRLAHAALKSETVRMEELGVRMCCGNPVAPEFLLEARNTYDAVFLGCGQWRGLQLRIPGEELQGVEDGLSFLRKTVQGEASGLQGPVAVVGGGNTAVDVARSVIRLGGKAILVYRRRREDMPAFQHEIRSALEEGVEIMELTVPVSIEADGSELLLTLQGMEVIDDLDSRKVRTQPNPDKRQVLRVRRIFKAIGLEAEASWTDPPTGASQGLIRLSNSVLVPEGRGVPVVYGGDPVTAVKSVAHAVASGKEAAMALDLLFQKGPHAVRLGLDACRVGGGDSLSFEMYRKGARFSRNSHVVAYGEINTDYFHFSPRLIQPRLLIEERVRTFAEIDLKISAGIAMREAERCFNCGLCNQCDNCRLFCPDLAVVREETVQGRRFNYDYCKGCGICAVECPRHVVSLREEGAEGGNP